MFTLQEIESLNELENFIFDYIRKNKEKVSKMTIRELANEVHVSTTSILRVCKKFQCNGFSEFKIKLKIYIEREKEINEKSDKILWNEFLEMMEKPEYNILLNKSVEQINNKKYLFFLGKGISAVIASYGAKFFTNLHKISFLIDDIEALNKYKLYDDSCTVVVSFTGEEEEIIRNIKEIKKQGGKVISITNSKKCTIANLSDINVPYYGQIRRVNDIEVPSHLYSIYIIEMMARRCIKLSNNEESISSISIKDINQ